MLRTLALLLLLAPLGALAQSYTGTYTASGPNGAPLTLTLKQDAKRGVTGALSGSGASFPLKGEVKGSGMNGVITANQSQVFIVAQLKGAQLDVLLADPGPDGKPNMNASRRLLFVRSDARPGAAAPAGSGGDPLSQVLTRNPWCAFSYNKNTGTSRTERVVFHPNGTLQQTSGAETYNSGPAGSVAGQHRGGSQGRWKVANGMLHLSEDGSTWTPQPLQVTQNSNGYPIIKSEGKEYMVCK